MYHELEGPVKAMLENQVILLSLMKADTRMVFTKVSQQNDLLGPFFEDSVSRYILALKERLINDITSSNDQ